MSYNYMSHGLPDVSLQSTQHEAILLGLWEVTSKRQVILHDPFVTSMVLMVQNRKKCITYIYYKIKQLLTYVSVDIECYWTVNIILTDAESKFNHIALHGF